MPLIPLPNRRQAMLAGAACCVPAVALAAKAVRQDFWSALREPGTVVLMRHALTDPGVGDPPGFELGSCATQRNLSDAGRAQAQRVAEAFQARGLQVNDVRSSAWCRCMDTARLAFGRVLAWPPLNSTFTAQGDVGWARTDVQAAVRGWTGPGPLVLVTHQVNIRQLTGQNTAMGEMLAARFADGRLQVLARLSV